MCQGAPLNLQSPRCELTWGSLEQISAIEIMNIQRPDASNWHLGRQVSMPGSQIFFKLLRQLGNKQKKALKMRIVHLDSHKKSTKRVLQVFLAKQISTSSIFFYNFFFLANFFFRKIVMTLTLKQNISQKKHEPEPTEQ